MTGTTTTAGRMTGTAAPVADIERALPLGHPPAERVGHLADAGHSHGERPR
ncbi:hypothetical protein ACWD0J_02465 [Streptomyces sp. NPDC003011]